MCIHPLAAIWAVAVLLVIAIVLTACGERKPRATWQEIITTQRMTEAHQQYQDHRYGCYEAYRVGMELGLAPAPDETERLMVVAPMMERLNCPTIANIGLVIPDDIPTAPMR